MRNLCYEEIVQNLHCINIQILVLILYFIFGRCYLWRELSIGNLGCIGYFFFYVHVNLWSKIKDSDQVGFLPRIQCLTFEYHAMWCADRIIPPNDIQIFILGNCEYMRLHGKKGFRLHMEFCLLISWLIWRDYFGLSKKPQCNYKGPYKW